jgi:hypothetical protein
MEKYCAMKKSMVRFEAYADVLNQVVRILQCGEV